MPFPLKKRHPSQKKKNNKPFKWRKLQTNNLQKIRWSALSSYWNIYDAPPKKPPPREAGQTPIGAPHGPNLCVVPPDFFGSELQRIPIGLEVKKFGNQQPPLTVYSCIVPKLAKAYIRFLLYVFSKMFSDAPPTQCGSI